MNELKLGQKVKFNKILIRKTSHDLEGKYKRYVRKKIWILKNFSEKDTEGILIGIRTLYNGELYDSGLGVGFKSRRHFRAYLIAYSVNRKPVFVPVNEVKFDS